MIIIDINPKRAIIIAEFADGKSYDYALTDLIAEEQVAVLAAAVGFATLELKRADTELKVWEAEQFLALREEQPGVDGKKGKRLAAADAAASLKTSDGYTRLRGAVGRAAASANMLEVIASMVSAGKFRRHDRNHVAPSSHS